MKNKYALEKKKSDILLSNNNIIISLSIIDRQKNRFENTIKIIRRISKASYRQGNVPH